IALSATQLNATANVPGTFAYAPTLGTILNAAAAQTLSVTFTPTDTAQYATTTTSVPITVRKATPVITWANPADIMYGTPVGATQLNATANVEGTFVYSPAAGTVLMAGAARNLSVAFTPANTTNYTGAGASVSITVQKRVPAISWPVPASITE